MLCNQLGRSISSAWSQPTQLSQSAQTTTLLQSASSTCSCTSACLPTSVRLVLITLLVFLSPTITHQNSSFSPGKNLLPTRQSSPNSSSLSSVTNSCTSSSVASPKAWVRVRTGQRLQAAAILSMSLPLSTLRRSSSSISVNSAISLTLQCSCSSWADGRSRICSSGESLIHMACTNIWQNCMVKISGFRQPREETTSTNAWVSLTHSGNRLRISCSSSLGTCTLWRWSSNSPCALLIGFSLTLASSCAMRSYSLGRYWQSASSSACVITSRTSLNLRESVVLLRQAARVSTFTQQYEQIIPKLVGASASSSSSSASTHLMPARYSAVSSTRSDRYKLTLFSEVSSMLQKLGLLVSRLYMKVHVSQSTPSALLETFLATTAALKWLCRCRWREDSSGQGSNRNFLQQCFFAAWQYTMNLAEAYSLPLCLSFSEMAASPISCAMSGMEQSFQRAALGSYLLQSSTATINTLQSISHLSAWVMTRTVMPSTLNSSSTISRSNSFIPSQMQPMPQSMMCSRYWSLMRLAKASICRSLIFFSRLGAASAASSLTRSRAVMRACFLSLTTTRVLRLQCSTFCMRFFCIMCRRDSRMGCSQLLKTTYTLLGRTLGWKLNVFSGDAPIHSATSRQSARLQLRQIRRRLSGFQLAIRRMRLTTTYRAALFSDSRCRLSTTIRPIQLNPLRLFQRLLSTSQAQAVVTIRSQRARIWASLVRSSKVRPTCLRPSNFRSIRVFFSAMAVCETISTAFLPACNTWLMASSAKVNFPLPSLAPRNTFYEESRKARAACVCTWFRWPILSSLAMGSSEPAGRGCRSSSSVGGANLEGSSMLLKERGRTLSAQTQRSETTLMQQSGCMTSKRGTTNWVEKERDSELRVKQQLYRTVSSLQSNTISQNGYSRPWCSPSHLKSAVAVRSTCRQLRVRGWAQASICTLGTWCTNL